MTEALPKTYLADLQRRCLFDSVEFLFKTGIISDTEVCTTEDSVIMQRARNLFYMKEYYQVQVLLKCAEETNTYNYCTCCPKDRVFLRNYSVYILSSIKSERPKNPMVGGVAIKDKNINDEVREVLKSKDSAKSVLTQIFDDPYLSLLFILSNKHTIMEKVLKRALLSVIKVVPYFWEPYKILTDIVTLSDIDGILQSIPDKTMSVLFMLHLGSSKCILHSKLKLLVMSTIHASTEEETTTSISTENETSMDDTVPLLDHKSGMFPMLGYAKSYISSPRKPKSVQPTVSCAFARDPIQSEYVQGMIASVLGHYKKHKESLELFEQLVDGSCIKDNLDQFANLLYSLKETEKLSSLLLTVYSRYYNLPIYHYVAGNLLALKMNHVESIEQFQRILSDTHPGELDIAYVFVAQEYFHMKDTCSAIKACNLAIKKNYNDHRVWYNMAQIYYSIEMYEYALHFFRKCAEFLPSNPTVYEGLGQCFEKLEREEEAVRCYKKGIDRNSIEALSLLGDLLHRTNNVDYIKYYKKYLNQCFAQQKSDKTRGNLETAEKFIEALEEIEDPKIILGWRNSLSMLRHQASA